MATAQDGGVTSLGEADALQREILTLREKAETLATELSHRFHHAFDLRARLREHRGPLIAVGVGVVVLVSVVTLVKIRNARRQRSLTARIGRKLGALGTIVREPEVIVANTHRRTPDYGKVMTALMLAGISLATRLVFRKL